MFANFYASYACVYRDRAAFAEAIKALAGRVSRHDWVEGYPYDACMRWAAL
jgi:hypothetical protein